jgi:hypothetical protein
MMMPTFSELAKENLPLLKSESLLTLLTLFKLQGLEVSNHYKIVTLHGDSLGP